ncbi:MAG: phosphonate C-P lyase system protein PhnH [Stanieria sp.]
MLKIETIWQPHTQQRIFRQLLQGMSLPGTIIDLQGELATSSGLVGILATLLDRSVTWSDEDNLVSQRDRTLLQATLTETEKAQFIVKDASKPPRSQFSPPLGELANPERGATLILVGEALGIGNLHLQLAGAGIESTRQISLVGFESQWFSCRQQWVAHFPLGVDLILLAGTRLMAIPRTTQISNY